MSALYYDEATDSYIRERPAMNTETEDVGADTKVECIGVELQSPEPWMALECRKMALDRACGTSNDPKVILATAREFEKFLLSE